MGLENFVLKDGGGDGVGKEFSAERRGVDVVDRRDKGGIGLVAD